MQKASLNKAIKNLKGIAFCYPFLFLCFATQVSFSQFNFQDSIVVNTYKSIINLETTKAHKQLKTLNDTNRYDENGIVPLLENYLDIISLLTTENQTLYKQLKPNESSRMRRIRRLNKDSPYYLYAQADIKLQWAFVELVFEDYVNGFLDLKKANDLIDKNIKRYPDFALNSKVKGLIDLLTEATPQEANFALFAAGLQRSTDGNRKLIYTSVFEPLFKDEIDIYLSFVNTYVKRQPELGLSKIKKTYQSNPKNLFAQFTYANILSQLDKNQEVLNLLNTNPLHTESEYLYIPYLDYLLGESEMKMKNFEKSKQAFKKFLSKSSTTTFKSTASFKLALLYAAAKQPDSSRYYMERIKLDEKNDLYLDQYAQFSSSHKTKLLPALALSNILYDGKHYFETYSLLLSTPNYKNSKVSNCEKYYRLAAAAQKLGKIEESKTYYQLSIDFSNKNDFDYFGAYSALKLGYIVHSENNLEKAKELYLKSKSFKNHFYTESVKQYADYKLDQIGK